MPYIIVEKNCISCVRQQLQELKLLRENERIKKLASGTFAIPVLPTTRPEEAIDSGLLVNGKSYRVEENINISPSLSKNPHDKMVKVVEIHMKEKNMWWEELRREIPASWIKYGDLILFGRNYFQDSIWRKVGDSLWQEVCKALKVKRLGRMNGIKPDGFRSPRVEIIYGDNSWVNVVDGHLRYTWDVRFCMFSPGNATERFRVARMNCLNETVVDMYAGIGYFTIPFLVHAKAEYVHSCEWNPHAVEALRKNLCNNKVSRRCHIHVGDNREVCPQNIADRVYLGLIPSCQPGIETACKALKFLTGGVLHLHENVSSGKNLSKNSLPLKVSQGRTSPSPSDSSAVPTGNGTMVVLKSELADKLLCQKCKEIEKKIFMGLDDRTKNRIISCDESQRFNYCESFTVKGSEGVIYEYPSLEVTWKKKEWYRHAIHLSHTVCSILSSFHSNPWLVSVISMHHVKSYAPHIDHLVYDLKCCPVEKTVAP